MNTGMGSHSLLQGIFPTQESNPDLLHCRQILDLLHSSVYMSVPISQIIPPASVFLIPSPSLRFPHENQESFVLSRYPACCQSMSHPMRFCGGFSHFYPIKVSQQGDPVKLEAGGSMEPGACSPLLAEKDATPEAFL